MDEDELEKKAEILMKEWEIFAKTHGIELNTDSDWDIKRKAMTCIKYGGVCPCLPRWRNKCPCPECLKEVKEANACYCMVFIAKGKKVDYKEHSKMTKRVREQLGIG